MPDSFLKNDSPIGVLMLLSGPSGSGKTTVRNQLMKKFPNLKFSVSCTTRTPRPNEKEAKDYFFISREEFEKKINEGDFLEYACVHDNYYGTPRQIVENQLLNGQDILLDIDVQGAALVRKAIKGTTLEKSFCDVFFAPPSLEELEKRLRGRATDCEQTIRKRLENAKKELDFWRDFSFLVINCDLKKTVNQLTAIFTAAHCRTDLRK